MPQSLQLLFPEPAQIGHYGFDFVCAQSVFESRHLFMADSDDSDALSVSDAFLPARAGEIGGPELSAFLCVGAPIVAVAPDDERCRRRSI